MDSETSKKVTKGMLWVGLEKFAIHILRFAFAIILARLLTPSDYGVVGLLTVFFAFSSMIVDSGFGKALIQKKNRNEIDYSTVFYFNVSMAGVCYAILFFAAPAIATFYGVPILKDVCRVLSLTIPLSALMTIPTTRLMVELDFKTQTKISIVSLVVSSSLGIVLAYCGYGVWALVWQSLVSSIISLGLLWWRTRWHPMWTFSSVSFRRFFSFGWKVLGSGVINSIYDNIYALVIGKSFGVADVGFFSRAEGYAKLPSGIVNDMLVKVNFPILSSYQDDNVKLLDAYRHMLRWPMFILVPALWGLSALASPLISVMIGDQWLPCVVLLQVFCVGAIFDPLVYVNLSLLLAKGRSDCVLKLEFIKKPIAFFIVFAMIPHGVFWLCVGRSVYVFIAFAINCFYTRKYLGYGFLSQIREILPILFNGTLMFFVVSLSVHWISLDWLKILVGFVVGVVSYGGVAWAIRDETFMCWKKHICNQIRRH